MIFFSSCPIVENFEKQPFNLQLIHPYENNPLLP